MATEDIEKALKALPADDLNQMMSSLQEIISQLIAKQKELDNLEKTLRESEEDSEEILKDIEVIRIRILYLIEQSRIGLDHVVMAQGTRSKQGAEVERFTILFTELESWLENAKELLRQNVNPNKEQEIVFLIQAFENLLKELRTKSQDLAPLSRKLEQFEKDPDLVGISSSLRPRLEAIRQEFSQLDQLLKDRIDSLQEIHVVFINRGRKPEDEPVVKPLAATSHDQESKPTPIFIPKARKGDPLSKPDGSLTNVCRVDEAFTTFLPPHSTDSTFKPIPMSESRKPKHKKPPTISTESFEDPSGSLPEEYSAEQVSQKVFDFLEIDQPERDDMIESRASPIPTEEIIDLDSPRFEYYEEIKFKKPVLFGQTRQLEKHEIYETTDLPEAEPEYKEYLDGKKMLVEEPSETRRTHRYLIKGVDPRQVKEYKYVRLPTESEESIDESSFDQPSVIRIRQGTRRIVRTVRRIIRKVVIINGVETVTEEVVEEPVEESVTEFDRPEIEELEGDEYVVVREGEEPKRLEYIKVEKPDSSPSESFDGEFERRIKTSILRPEAKEFTPSSSTLSKSTDISLPTTSTPSSESTQLTKFQFVVRETVQPLTQTQKAEEPKKEVTSPVDMTEEDSIKGIKPQRKKKKKRKGEKTQEEPEDFEDDFAPGNEDDFEDKKEKPGKPSFLQALIFGKKERTPEDAKPKDTKTTREITQKKTEETTLSDEQRKESKPKDKEDKITLKQTEKRKSDESVHPRDKKSPMEDDKDAQKRDKKPDIKQEKPSDKEPKKFVDTLIFLESEKTKVEEPVPGKKERPSEDKTKPQDKDNSERKHRLALEKEKPSDEPIKKTGKDKLKPEDEPMKTELEKEKPKKKKDEKVKSPEDKTKPLEKTEVPKNPTEESSKKEKPEKDKPTLDGVKITETIKKPSEEPTKEDSKKKEKKGKSLEEKTQPEVTVVTTPKTVEIETVKFMKHEKTPDVICENKPKEEPLKKETPEKELSEPTDQKLISKDKPKEDTKKKGKSPETDKPTAEDAKQPEQFTLTDHRKLPKEPTKEEEKPQKTELLRKKDKKEKSPEEEQVKSVAKRTAEKVPEEGKPKSVPTGEPTNDQQKPEEPTNKTKKQKTPEKEEPNLADRISGITKFFFGERPKEEPKIEDIIQKDKTQPQKPSEKDKEKSKTPEEKSAKVSENKEKYKQVEEPGKKPKGKQTITEITEAEKPKDDFTKRKSPEEEKLKKDQKKPKDITAVTEITKFIGAEKPERVEPSEKQTKPVEDFDKKPKDKKKGFDVTERDQSTDDFTKKGNSPDTESSIPGVPVEDDKKPKDKTILEITKTTVTGEAVEDDKKPKDKTTFEFIKTTETGKSVDDDKKPKDKSTVEFTKTVETGKPVEDGKKPKDRKKKSLDKDLPFEEKTKDKPREPETVKETKPEASRDEPTKKGFSPDTDKPKETGKPVDDDKKPKGTTIADVTKFIVTERPEEVESSKKGKKGLPQKEEPFKIDGKPIEEDQKPKDKKPLDVIKIRETEKPEEPSKKGKKDRREREEPKKKDEKPIDYDQKPKDQTTVKVTEFIQTEKLETTVPRKKDGKPVEDDKKPKDKKTGTEKSETVEPSKKGKKDDSPDKEEPLKKDDKLLKDGTKPTDKEMIEVIETVKPEEVELTRKGKTGRPEDKVEDDQKPQDKNVEIFKVTVLDKSKPVHENDKKPKAFEPTKKGQKDVPREEEPEPAKRGPKGKDEPGKKGISPDKEEPFKKDEKPVQDDKKPKDETAKFIETERPEAIEPTKRGKKGAPEEKEPGKNEGSLDKEEPLRKDVKPVKDDKKPKDISAVEISKFIETERPEATESTKRGKKGSPQNKDEPEKKGASLGTEEPPRKADKPVQEDKKLRDKTVFEITEAIETKKPDSIERPTKGKKDLPQEKGGEPVKKPQDETSEKSIPPEKEKLIKKAEKPTEDEKKPKGITTVTEITKVIEIKKPEELEPIRKGKKSAPQEEEPFKKDGKPDEDDKKPKDEKPMEVMKVTETEKFEELEPSKRGRKGDYPKKEEPRKKDEKPPQTTKDKKTTEVIKITETEDLEPFKKGKKDAPKEKDEFGKKGMSPDKQEPLKKGEKPRDKTTIIDVTELTRRDKMDTPEEKDESEKKGVSPDKEPLTKDSKPVQDDKKPKDKTVIEITEAIETRKPEAIERSKRDKKSSSQEKDEPGKKGVSSDKEKPQEKDGIAVEYVKKPKDKSVIEITEKVEGSPKEIPGKKGVLPDKKEPLKKDEKPDEDDKKPILDVTKFIETERPEGLEPTKRKKKVTPEEKDEPGKKGVSPDKEEPIKKDGKPIKDDDKKPKDKTIIEVIETIESGKPETLERSVKGKKGKSQEKDEPTKKEDQKLEDKKPVELIKPIDVEKTPREKIVDVPQKAKTPEAEKPTKVPKDEKHINAETPVELEKAKKEKPEKDKTSEEHQFKPVGVETEAIKLIEYAKPGREKWTPSRDVDRGTPKDKTTVEITKLSQPQKPSHEPTGTKTQESLKLLEFEKPQDHRKSEKPGKPTKDEPGRREETPGKETKKPKDQTPENSKPSPAEDKPKDGKTQPLPGEPGRKQSEQLKPEKPKDISETEKEKPKPNERTKTDQKFKEETPLTPVKDLTEGEPSDKKVIETITFLEFERPSMENQKEKPSQKDRQPEKKDEPEEKDKRKPADKKIIETSSLLVHEKSSGRETIPGRDKPDEETTKKIPEKSKPTDKTFAIETTELLEYEKSKKEPRRERADVLRKKGETPEKDKLTDEKPKQPEQAEPMKKDSMKPGKEGKKAEKTPEEDKPKEKPDLTKELKYSEIVIREDKPTAGKPETEKFKAKKPGEDKPEEKLKPTIEGVKPVVKLETEDIKKKKEIEPKKSEKPKEDVPVGKVEENKPKRQTLQPERSDLPKKSEEPSETPKDTKAEVTKKGKTPDRTKESPEGREPQRIDVVLRPGEQPEDTRLREILVGRIDKPNDTKATFASIVGKGKERKTPESETRKRIDVFISREQSQEPTEDTNKPKEPEKLEVYKPHKPKDQKFIEKETTPEAPKMSKDKRPEEPEQEGEQAPDGSSTITGTLVSMAKSFFGFGGKKQTSQDKIPEADEKKEDTKPSEEKKKRRKRKSKKKGQDVEEEEEDEDVEELEEEESEKVAPTKPRRRRRGKRKGPKPGEEDEEEDEGEEDVEEEEDVEDFETVPEDGSPDKPTRKRRTKKKGQLGEDEEEEEEEDNTKMKGKPRKPGRRTRKPGQTTDNEEEEDEEEDEEKPQEGNELNLGWSVPAKEPQIPDSERTILFRYDPHDPMYQKSMDNRPQHGVMSAQVDPKLDSKTPSSKEDTSDLKPSAPTFADLFTQTSPETSPRGIKPKDSKTTEEGVQTETDKIDSQNQTDPRRPSKDITDSRKQTIEKSQQTSKPQSPSFKTIGTSPDIITPEDSTPEKPADRTKTKADRDVDDKKPTDIKPGEKSPDDSFDVHLTAKVSVTQPEVPTRSKKGDKKERRKRKDQPEDEDVEVSSTISVQTPRDLIEAERVNIDVKPTPQTEIRINVKPKETLEFLDSERKFTKEDPDDSEGRKGKKGRKPVSDSFRKRESGAPRDSSPSSDETPDDGKLGIGIDVHLMDKPDTIRQKPEEDKYKVTVDVKVKSGDVPEDSGRIDIGTNFPSPREPLDPKEFVLHLQKTSDLGKSRVKKIQNMKNNPRVMTFMIPKYQSLPETDIKKTVKDIDSDVAKLRDAIKRKDYVLVRRIFVYLIKNIDDWLETVEYRIILNRQNSNEGPNRDKVKELKSLKDEITGVKRNVTDLLKNVKDVPDDDVMRQLRIYIQQLEPQITEIQDMTETEEETEVKNLSRWEEFLNGVNNLSVLVEELRQNLDRVIDSDGSADSKLQELEKMESANREYGERAVNLINMAKDMANEFPNQEIPPETYATFETTKIIQNNLNAERDRLLQLLSLGDEYEQTLKEFAQIIEVADNLVESPITITSLEHLQDEMQKHRKFFVNLSHCRAILESLEGNLDGETRGIHNQLHGKLHAKASSILDKAASRAQQMAMAASRWTMLDKGVRNEQQWLQVAHQRLPDLQQVMSSDYDQYISLYQSLASDTAIHHTKILQLMDVANKLQDIISCVGLEKFHDDYLNVILKLQEEIQSSLEKLIAFQTIWTLYEIMANKLDVWMTTAEEDLKNLKGTPRRASMRQFWELKAQYEMHNRLRQDMGNNFEKAVQYLPIADDMIQRQILGKLEDRWKKLENEIKEIQDSAMATLSAQDVPVNEKLKLLEDELNELNDTVDDLHGIIKTDEELNLYIERLQVLSDRLDTIQEELGRLGLLPATESEKVGYLLGLGRRLEQQLLEELHESTLLREKLLALQKGLDRVKRNQNSASSLLDQCGVAETMGSDMVEQAVTNCENISADLSEQWQDMMDLRQVLHTLPMRLRLTVSPIKVEREISQLQEVHTVLEEKCRNLLHLLRNRLSMWRRFEKQLEKVQQNVQETDYMVELLTLQGSVDFDRLQTATDRLKDLHDSVGQREELIKELRRLAEPLAKSCSPEVASQLNAQVDEAVTAWNDSRKNLYHIVDKYKDAVKLWKNYREARDDMRKWIDQQWHTLDLMQDKPEQAVEQIKEFKETLATQKARLDELKKLVAQIAADIGLDPGGLLECEVEDLGKRLEDVKETLTTLTSVAESRTQGKDVCKDELVKAKKFLNSVQKSLNVVGEDGNENTLSTLRDHLLALGKTESKVQNVKEKSIKMNEKPHEIKSETSVVEILELWQQVFRETFQQYYRLSAKLVRSQDGAAALQLWQEYLRHVQTFLAGSLPEDYDGLRETQRLCEVHQNLLTSQQSVLSSRKDDPAIKDFSQALQEQFNSLANLHNETLARIMDRHNEVNKRLKMWDSYRLDQSKLLSWLRDMTRDQSRLQLRYIHLRRLPKLLEQIEILLSKIPQGKSLIQEQQKQQDDIVKFCDEALATSIKMETVATAERINNLEASLKSWKDFLIHMKDLYKNYEMELENVEKVCDEVTNELASPAPVSFSAIQNRLDLCRDLRSRIAKYAKNIEEANVTYDQLKECLSPHDMKMLSQRLWLMGQRQGDLEHHLLLQILWLEDRLETQQAFNLRQARFLNWANDLIQRFDKPSSLDPATKYLDFETRAKRLESEVQIELSLKEREYNALHAMAKNIIDLSKEDSQDRQVMPPGQNRIDYEIMKSEVDRKLKEIDDVWDQLKNLKYVRLERKSKLLKTMNDLWKRMEDIKFWLISIEEKLEAPSVIEKNTDKCKDKLLKDHELIQQEIEKQSGNVGEVLNLGELFLADPAVDLSGIDTNEFESTMQALEKRWKSVCLSSSERKGRILGAWELLLQLSKICKDQEKWISEREKALQALSTQSETPKLNDVPKLLTNVDKEKRELDSKAPALKILDASYSKLAQESRLPAENIQQLAGPAKSLMSRWHNLYDRLKQISSKLSKINKLRDDFIRNQNNSIVLLTNISAKLMQAELLSNPKKRLKEVNKLEKELEKESGCLKSADETGLELMRTCSEPQNVAATQKMVDEYQVMWKELKDRFAQVKNKSLENLESKEIQVSTLAFETDSEVQVDTLPHMDRLTSRDAYGMELDVALRECDQNLRGLEKILQADGESGSTVPTHKTLAKIIATCTSSVELVQHLNQTLVEECGMSDTQARTPQVKEVSVRFQELVERAREKERQLREASERGRLTCPICSRRNWQQLENDLWRLEQWIQYAEAIQNNRPSLPSSIEALEHVIQNHRELLIELDSHKSIIVSLNIVGDHLADHVDDVEKARELRERLRGLNLRWDKVCSLAAQWQVKLQEALIENPEFHDAISELVQRLENTEAVIRNSEPVDLAQDRIVLESQYKKFKALSKELERYEPRVVSLQEAAVQLLERGGSARERLNALRLRLTGMRRLIKVYLLRLGAVLGSESVEALDQTLMSLSQEILDGTDSMIRAQTSSTAHTDGEGDTEMGRLERSVRYMGRVIRASLPIQALILLLLGAAALVPDEYYSCAFSNNARFQSYYPNGPPPI